ncbi:zinc-binding alcohol dehydrogenase family protein [Promicromonospora sp. Populi]|uniref:zinc-binding alcohol dehydrogenase family protein n=1 Tax=Promicromonospora sp. Populi TaxID=3239420 RepID=UPI0034E24380
MTTMRAVAAGGPDHKLVDVELPMPSLRAHDLLVRVAAVSVNPADVKIAARAAGKPRILGFDAVGTVVEVGSAATGFAAGDEVYYAGDITRQGANAEFQAIDARLVGHKPAQLSVAEAAAMPLTTITAWESLFTHLAATPDTTGSLVVVGAAGGVGSVLIQLAKLRTALHVIGTSSRQESSDWVTTMGADVVVDHRSLAKSVKAVAPEGVDALFSSYSTGNIQDFAEIVKPFGHIVAIDDGKLDLGPLKSKSIAWHWELMFTHAMYSTPDMASQGQLLNEAADLFDAGSLRTTLTTELDDFSAAGIQHAHDLVASGRTIGKVVVRR